MHAGIVKKPQLLGEIRINATFHLPDDFAASRCFRERNKCEELKSHDESYKVRGGEIAVRSICMHVFNERQRTEERANITG